MTNEKRLIDANALLAELDKFANPMPNKSGYDFLCGVASVITEIEDAPTVDAVEVVHGQWLTDRFGLDRSICSVCDACYEGDGGNYCRRCGAKMDK